MFSVFLFNLCVHTFIFVAKVVPTSRRYNENRDIRMIIFLKWWERSKYRARGVKLFTIILKLSWRHRFHKRHRRGHAFQIYCSTCCSGYKMLNAHLCKLFQLPTNRYYFNRFYASVTSSSKSCSQDNINQRNWLRIVLLCKFDIFTSLKTYRSLIVRNGHIRPSGCIHRLFPCGVCPCSLVTCHTDEPLFCSGRIHMLYPLGKTKVHCLGVTRHKVTRAQATREQPMNTGPNNDADLLRYFIQ